MRLETVVKYSLVLIAVVAFFWAAYHAQAFLVPLTFAAILAMMLVPVSHKLESWGWSRTWSALASTFIMVILVIGVVVFLSTQASSFASEFPDVWQQVTGKYQALRRTAQEQWHISLPAPRELLDSMTQSSGKNDKTTGTNEPTPGAESSSWPNGPPYRMPTSESPFGASRRGGSEISGAWISSVAGPIAQFVSNLVATSGDMLLAVVYIFALLYYRGTFQEFLLRLTPAEEHSRVNRMVDEVSRVARQYLWGRLLLIFILAVLYGVGFLVIGLKHALFLAIMAAIFSIVPYIGPLLGLVFPVLVALATQHSLTPVLGVLVVFSVAQFVESYLLEPIIVGSEVDINPFFTIVAVVGGGLLWGMPGMILGIPLVGMARIVFGNIGPLQPYAFLLGEQHDTGGATRMAERIKRLFRSP
jgi:predicted PurR-regulated permease PerM